MLTSQKQKILLISLVIFALIVVVLIGIFSYIIFCNNNVARREEGQIEESQEQAYGAELNFLKKFEVGDGYFPGIVFDDSTFYIFFERHSDIYVKEYDEGFTLTGQEKKLMDASGPNFQVVFDGNYFFIVGAQFLRKFDLNCNEMKSISYYDLLPQDIAEKWEYGVDDMLLYQNSGTVFIGIAVGGEKVNKEDKDAKKEDTPGSLFVQKFDTDLVQIEDFLIEDVGNAPGSSMISQEGNLIVVTSNKRWDDSSLIVLQYDEDLNPLERKVISEVENANEEFPMGFAFSDDLYFVGYHHITGDLSMPMEGNYLITTDVVLKAFDKDWNMISEVLVTEEGVRKSDQNNAGRPHLVYMNDKIYIAYDVDHRIYVKEYEVVKH